MARIITGVLERVDPDQQVVLVGAVVLRVSRQELIHGLKEGMRVRVRCEQSGDETWATALSGSFTATVDCLHPKDSGARCPAGDRPWRPGPIRGRSDAIGGGGKVPGPSSASALRDGTPTTVSDATASGRTPARAWAASCIGQRGVRSVKHSQRGWNSVKPGQRRLALPGSTKADNVRP